MSIPPLVCSTPPPPDQCEEDKDHEDFDIRYNLSQEDEDDNNEYVYDSFSTFNHFHTHPSSDVIQDTQFENNPMIVKNQVQSIPDNPIESQLKTENNQSKEAIELQLSNIDSEIMSENSLKSEEDNNIEDLNLKLEECTTPSKTIIESDDLNNISISDETITIPVDGVVPEQNMKTSLIVDQDKAEDITISNNELGTFDVDPHFLTINRTVGEKENIVCHEADLSNLDSNESSKMQETLPECDFEDFDDFKYTSPEIESKIVIENCDNPWEGQMDEIEEFSDFTANFEHITNNEPEYNNTPLDNEKNFSNKNVSQDLEDDDDEFGDFDDFKSSNVADTTKHISNEEHIDINQQLPVLNLEVSDKGHQILDSVNQVLNSIFLEDIKEPDNEFECKLDSLLSETWGHLIETDERQPYMVNWNNSLGQKTLLRALSIDSRNILFGPKWSYNMPKYAVNLSTAPLQPLKTVVQTTTYQNDISSMEKVANKVGNWNDPFTSDGQESCNTEKEITNKERKPANVEVFESQKPESVYPSNISVQPIRQISLPDTHIFTPTDSETPRSKTIHYDTGPTVLLSEQHSNNRQTYHSENNILRPESNTADKFEDDYWEFQDFKCTPKLNEAPSSSNTLVTTSPQGVTTDSDDQHKLNNTYPGNLLQPIKISPVVPTLNWPNPGEVKEVFDDFSDFISSTSWSKESKNNSEELSNNGVIVEHGAAPVVNDKVKDKHLNGTETNQHNDFYDDFDTFQYALPTQKTNEIDKVDNLNIVTNSRMDSFTPKALIPNQNAKFEEAFTNLNINLCDNISSTNQLKHNLSATKNMFSIPKAPDSSSKPILPFQSQSNILQPIQSSSNNQTQQKTAQILQPLSLESYSQLNWPSPGIDLQDLSKFNPVETLHSLKSDLTNNVSNKSSSPIHNLKIIVNNQTPDDELWGEFVSSKPKPQALSQKKSHNSGDDEEWTDFVSSPSVKPQNGVNTISFNVHTNSNIQKTVYQNKLSKNKQSTIDIPTLNYITPKTNNHNSCNDRHFQNL